jgi:DNA-binding NarL/FixJ family response regulator
MGASSKYPKIPSNKLVPREIEVLTLLAQGLTNPQIGERLGIARGTTEKHIHTIREKLDQSGERWTRQQLADYAIQQGIISVETGDDPTPTHSS